MSKTFPSIINTGSDVTPVLYFCETIKYHIVLSMYIHFINYLT